jgi:Ca-activated chloride channel homolog
MSFGALQYIWIVTTLPLVLFICFLRKQLKEKHIRSFADESLVVSIFPEYYKNKKELIKECLFIISLFGLIILAILRPQWGFTWQEHVQRGVSIVVAVDVSSSMLAADVAPNRLARAKHKIQDLLEIIRGDQVGLVSFAGVAFVESPLTIDYSILRSFVQSLSPELIPIQGTNIEAAIERSMDVFRLGGEEGEESNTETRRATNDKAIILISDGEFSQGNIDRALSRAKKLGIRVYTIGVGTSEGSPIPQGGNISEQSYKRDGDGNIVITRLNAQILKDIAYQTNGLYLIALPSNEDIMTIYQSGIKKSLIDRDFDDSRVKVWNEYFQVPLLLAILLMLFPSAVKLIRGAFLARNLSFIFLAYIIIFQLIYKTPALAQNPELLGKEGKESFEEGEFEQALEKFLQATEKEGDARYKIGIGSSLYRMQRFSEATEAFLQAAAVAKSEQEKAEALYNAGNSLAQEQAYEEAIKAYEDSLSLVPDDAEARENLAYVKKLLEEQQKQEQSEEQSEDQEDKNSEGGGKDIQDNKGSESASAEDENQSKDEGHNEDEQHKQDQSDVESNGDAMHNNTQAEEQNQQGKQAKDPQSASLLDNIQEDRSSFLDYRKNMAMEELKQQGLLPPEKDW